MIEMWVPQASRTPPALCDGHASPFTCQVITLAAGFAVFWIFEDKSLLSATGLVVATILSRLGLRGFDLCIQLIVQEVRLQPPRPLFSDAQGLLKRGNQVAGWFADFIRRKGDPQ